MPFMDSDHIPFLPCLSTRDSKCENRRSMCDICSSSGTAFEPLHPMMMTRLYCTI